MSLSIDNIQNRMLSIPSCIGKEISYTTDYNDNNIISCIIYPCEDLFIDTSIEIEIIFPNNYQITPSDIIIKTKKSQAHVFQNSMHYKSEGHSGKHM